MKYCLLLLCFCCSSRVFAQQTQLVKKVLSTKKFIAREKELINNTKGFEGYPNGLIESKNPYYFPDGMGNNGSDFTVGAVLLKRGMGNFFKGQIGGLAVFNRCLTEKELTSIVE